MRRTESDATLGWWSSIATAAGVVLSGPAVMAFLHFVAPQPAWTDAATFVMHYRRIQIAPYVLGVLLVGGATTMTAVHARRLIDGTRRALVGVALSAFVTMIGLNYVLQTTFVPSMVATYRPELATSVEHFSMASPHSLAWALEMWGYAFLGIATWLVVPSLRSTPLQRLAARLCVANAVLSLAGGVATAARLEWVFSPVGLACFGAWNVVMAALAVLSALVWREREAHAAVCCTDAVVRIT